MIELVAAAAAAGIVLGRVAARSTDRTGRVSYGGSARRTTVGGSSSSSSAVTAAAVVVTPPVTPPNPPPPGSWPAELGPRPQGAVGYLDASSGSRLDVYTVELVGGAQLVTRTQSQRLTSRTLGWAAASLTVNSGKGSAKNPKMIDVARLLTGPLLGYCVDANLVHAT